MNDVIDRILSTYQLMRPFDPTAFPIQGRELPDILKASPPPVKAIPSSWRCTVWPI